jgi:hypothetical protein
MNEKFRPLEDYQEEQVLKKAVWENFLAMVKSENKSASEMVAEYGFSGLFAGLDQHGIKDSVDLYQKLSIALWED